MATKEENTGGDKQVKPFTEAPWQALTPSKLTVTTAKAPTLLPSGGSKSVGYEELFHKLFPYTPMTDEDIAKERKKRKRDELFSAIGDGIMALSNLYFTTQGAPNMYTGKNTLSGATKVRYDKLIKERDEKNMAYFNGLVKAKQADAEERHRERSWQRQLGLDQKEEDRYQEGIDYRDKRDKIADDRYKTTWEYQKERDRVADDQWSKEFEEGKRRFNVSSNETKRHNKAIEGIQLRQIKQSEDGKYSEFYIPGGGLIKVKNTALNDTNISYVYSRCPSQLNITDKTGQSISPTTSQMLQHIGENVNNPNVQAALRAIGGEEKKGQGY